jgi:hypothetical protein
MRTAPWAHPGFRPADPGLRQLAYRALPASTPPWRPNAVANVSWTPDHVSNVELVVKAANVDPGVVVGITSHRECHPLITSRCGRRI